VTLTGVAASLSGARPDINLDMNTEYLNLGIDFGAVAAFALFFKLDFDAGSQLVEKVETRLQRKDDDEVSRKAMKEREQTVANLEINFRTSDVDENDDSTDNNDKMQRAPVRAVQVGGKQHVIIVAGGRKAVRDALLGASLMGSEFAIRDVLIVPYELGGKGWYAASPSMSSSSGSGGGGDGFGKKKRPKWETRPYVAEPVGDGWVSYIKAEMDDAIRQNNNDRDINSEGIVIVVSNTGEIVRRGLGKVPWRDTIEELEKKVKDEVEPMDLSFLGD